MNLSFKYKSTTVPKSLQVLINLGYLVPLDNSLKAEKTGSFTVEDADNLK